MPDGGPSPWTATPWTATPPPTRVLEEFGATGRLLALRGGQGTS
ncbi:hypothetical protein [Pengzhenrongella sp.]|jgi:hypothetical protein